MSAALTNNISVIGAGGIGCALAYALQTSGVDVTLVESDLKKVAWGQANGVGVVGHACVPIKVVAFDDWSPPTGASGDIVILSTKCYDNQTVLSCLEQGVEIIPVQNGFDRQLVDRVEFEGIASFVSECNSDQTQTRITRKGELHLGGSTDRHDHAKMPMREGLVQMLSNHELFNVRHVVDVRPFKYAKLMYNAAISPLAAISGLDNSKLLTLAPARRLFFAFLQENYQILTSAGIVLGKVGPFHPNTVHRILKVPMLARVMSIPFARSLRNTYCSMSGDIERGRTEIRNFNGHLVDLAGATPCELNRRACEFVEQMAAARAVSAVSYLDDFAHDGAMAHAESEGGVGS